MTVLVLLFQACLLCYLFSTPWFAFLLFVENMKQIKTKKMKVYAHPDFTNFSPFSVYLKSKTPRDWSDWPIMVLFLDWFPDYYQNIKLVKFSQSQPFWRKYDVFA